MTGADFLDLAIKLSAGVTEAHWRTSVSRSYYGAFHDTRRFLLQLGITVPGGPQAHGFMWLRLQNCAVPLAVSAGNDLVRLRSLRNQADYDIDHGGMTQDLARKCLLMAQSVLQKLDQCRVDPAKSLVLAGIKHYESLIQPPAKP